MSVFRLIESGIEGKLHGQYGSELLLQLINKIPVSCVCGCQDLLLDLVSFVRPENLSLQISLLLHLLGDLCFCKSMLEQSIDLVELRVDHFLCGKPAIFVHHDNTVSAPLGFCE